MENNIALKLRDSIKKHERFRKYPYTDTTGHISIGYGRNLTSIGISETEAEIMLNDDIVNATAELYRFLPVSQTLDDVRKAILIEMSFNMGIENLLQFRKMIEALKQNDFKAASTAMLDSEWANQVHARAHDLAYSMETGVL